MKGGVFALGNFDGVHRGHRAVIAAALDKARAVHAPLRVLTFEPHPRAFFHPNQPPFRLTPFKIKENLLKECGVDETIALPFDAELALMSARDFVERVLVERFGAQHVVAGHDFVFGAKRGGDMAKLAAWLEPLGVGVTEVGAMGDEGEVFSSTRVRELLLQGEAPEAAAILGRPWCVSGVVARGRGLGRQWGVPTANIDLGEYLRPKFGVYAIEAGRLGEALTVRGVANIGLRPTVAGESDVFEAHLFDFARDIYGQEWQFALTRFIRPERRFDSPDDLKAQIARDIENARKA